MKNNILKYFICFAAGEIIKDFNSDHLELLYVIALVLSIYFMVFFKFNDHIKEFFICYAFFTISAAFDIDKLINNILMLDLSLEYYMPTFSYENEWFRHILAYISIIMIYGIKRLWSNEKKDNNDKNKENDNDIITKLCFYERRQDYAYLKELIKNDKFKSIGIEGNWGVGKTYLMDAIIKYMTVCRKDFICIRIDSLACNIETAMEYISKEIDTALWNNGIWSNYSYKLNSTFSQKPLNVLYGIFNTNSRGYLDKFDEFKKEMNELNKTVVFVVDDIDRVQSSTNIYNILNLMDRFAAPKVSESESKIKVIYIYNRDKLYTNDITQEYIEKYIQTFVRLSSIEFISMAENLINNDKISYKNTSKKNILNNGSLRKIPPYTSYNLKEELSDDALYSLIKDRINLRTVKKYLIELDNIIADNKYDSYKVKNQVINELLIKILYIKHFIPEAFRDISTDKKIISNFYIKYQKNDDVNEVSIKDILNNDIKIDVINKNNILKIYAYLILDLYVYEINNEKKDNKKLPLDVVERVVYSVVEASQSSSDDYCRAAEDIVNRVLIPYNGNENDSLKLIDSCVTDNKNVKGGNKTIYIPELSKWMHIFKAFSCYKDKYGKENFNQYFFKLLKIYNYYIKEKKIKLEKDIIHEINFLFLCICNKDIFDKCVELITSMEIVYNLSDYNGTINFDTF